MSILSVHDIQGISAYSNNVRIPGGHQLAVEGKLKFPNWTTAGRPSPAETGQIGWNTELRQLEFYDDNEWLVLVSSNLGSETYPATSAYELVQNGQTTNGVYYIQPTPSSPKQQVFCILDPAYDGGGWMIVTNNSASGVLYNSSHVCRLTASSLYAGSSSGTNTYTPNVNFSVNCQDIQFNKLCWVIMDNNSTTSFIGSNGANVNGYIYYSWSSKQSIPTSQYFAFDDGLTGFSMGSQVSWPGFGAKRMNSDYGGYGQYSGQRYGFGTLHSSTRGTTVGTSTTYNLAGSGGYYPATVTFQGSAANSGATTAYYCWSFTDAYGTTPGAAQQAIGFDDWQDGSGLGDQWRCESTNDKSTTRGKPSFIMIK